MSGNNYICISKTKIMKSNIKPVYWKFTLYSAIILVLSIIIDQLVPQIPISPSWPYILIFLYFFTFAAFSILMKYLESRISLFANAFMLVNFGKLVLFTILILIYAWFNRKDAIPFTITFFIYYLLLTSYEIVSLLKIQKRY